ncbi:RCC1/BLIP-II [Wallemia mellicola]|uniref:RCC1/BLIP-II n=1 Tax=Wallemia mellicola TaxID=1708541 RepID=A0A4T0PQG9_9BASI|nr:RCC1/BLIP-II [Wallemia mellicola]TIC11191.1 RCC1/BLIP-II [Wallemia mellicola]TIC12458.1 RCC1/BLIP-II [Wallemia mellicola]TIC30142.1 RCC1/BLIP-II [Wallemia mellicola]TIC49303.1 RCC1/BLIP-II [Wallemia mellicola]
MCRRQPAIGRLCDKCDGKCPVCDSYVRPQTIVKICDECAFGTFGGKCVICGGPGISDAYYCAECTILEKDRDGCVKIVNLEQSTEDNPKPTRQSARAAAKASAAPKPKPKSPPKATKKRKADDNDIEIDNDRKLAKRRQPALEQVGDFGQFGLGVDTLGEIKRPRIHQWVEDAIEDDELGPEGVEQIAAGGMHNLMIDSNGKIWSWGVNDGMSLGRVTADTGVEAEELETVPMKVDGLDDFRAVNIAAGDYISLAIDEEGQMRAWGSFNSNDGLLGFDGRPGGARKQVKPAVLPQLAKHRVVQAVCGADHALALTTSGIVYAWGNGQQQQLGRRVIERRKLNGLTPEPLHIRNIVAVGTGSYHSFAIDKDGVVFGWGLNKMRQTGVSDERDGYEDTIAVPTPIDALHPDNHDGSRVIQISGGEHHTLFLFDNGEVWGCGRCDGKELGLSKDHPAYKEILENNEKTAQEAREEKAKKQGTSIEETEAPKTIADEFVEQPVRIQFPPPPTEDEPNPENTPYESGSSKTKIKQISAGLRHNLAVSDQGYVYSWGYGNACQLGQGNAETIEEPTRIANTALTKVNALYSSAGGQHCAILAEKKGSTAREEKKENDVEKKENEEKEGEEKNEDGDKEESK